MYVISGKNFSIQNITLNASTWVEIDPSSRFYSVLVKCRTSVDLYIKRIDTDTDYLTIPAGQSLSLAISMGVNNHFYLKAASSTPIAELVFAE